MPDNIQSYTAIPESSVAVESIRMSGSNVFTALYMKNPYALLSMLLIATVSVLVVANVGWGGQYGFGLILAFFFAVCATPIAVVFAIAKSEDNHVRSQGG